MTSGMVFPCTAASNNLGVDLIDPAFRHKFGKLDRFRSSTSGGLCVTEGGCSGRKRLVCRNPILVIFFGALALMSPQLTNALNMYVLLYLTEYRNRKMAHSELMYALHASVQSSYHRSECQRIKPCLAGNLATKRNETDNASN